MRMVTMIPASEGVASNSHSHLHLQTHHHPSPDPTTRSPSSTSNGEDHSSSSSPQDMMVHDGLSTLAANGHHHHHHNVYDLGNGMVDLHNGSNGYSNHHNHHLLHSFPPSSSHHQHHHHYNNNNHHHPHHDSPSFTNTSINPIDSSFSSLNSSSIPSPSKVPDPKSTMEKNEPITMDIESPDVKEVVEEGEVDGDPDAEEEPSEEVDINITNVVSIFATRCHLNLRQIANTGANVVYNRAQGMVLMKLRSPKCTASLWSSGKVSITGNTSEESSYKAARRIARIIQRLGFRVKFSDYRITNVLGIVHLPFGIKLETLAEMNTRLCSYEPELHPGATYRWKDEKAVYKIYQTGAITITAPSVAAIDKAVQYIYPIVIECRKEKVMSRDQMMKRKREEDMNQLLALAKVKRSKGDIPNGKNPRSNFPSDEHDDQDEDFVVSDNDEEPEQEAVSSEEEAEFTDDDD